MDLTLSAEQTAVRQLAAEFVDREIDAARRRLGPRANRSTPPSSASSVTSASSGLTIAEAHGGSGGDHLAYCLVLEELGRGDSAVRGMVSVSLGLVGQVDRRVRDARSRSGRVAAAAVRRRERLAASR